MANLTSFSALRAVCLDLPSGHPAASAAVAQREAILTKPPQSLGRLEDLVAWLAHPGWRTGRVTRRRGSIAPKSWSSPAITASPRAASRPIRRR
jgi:NaMN:DMB phosphoribosyltransferase